MPEGNQNQDINFQPKTQEFTYSNKNQGGNKLKIFFIISILLTLGLFTAGILNYLNIISLSNLSPVFKNLPKSEKSTITHNIPGNNQYLAQGTLAGYNKEIIKVKVDNQIISFRFNLGKSQFYTKIEPGKQFISSKSGAIKQDIGFFSDLEKEDNIGKKITILYIIEKNENIIQEIILGD